MNPEVSTAGPASVTTDTPSSDGAKKRGRPKGSRNGGAKRKYRKSPTKMGAYVQNLRERVVLKCATCGDEKDLTTADLAFRAGVDEAEVKKIERSKRSPDPEVFTKVMNTVTQLYKETESRNAESKKSRRRGRRRKKAVSHPTEVAPAVPTA